MYHYTATYEAALTWLSNEINQRKQKPQGVTHT